MKDLKGVVSWRKLRTKWLFLGLAAGFFLVGLVKHIVVRVLS